MQAPLVSVIIPAFRAEATLARAVASLKAQSEPSWQALIVADDGADYRPLLAAAGLLDERLVFLSTGRIAAGAPAARNVGLAAAKGRLVAPLDADDLYYPERLARLAPLALAAGAAFDNVRVVEEESEKALQLLFPEVTDFTLEAERFLATSVPLMAVARRELLRGWDPAVALCDDVAFNLTLFDRVPRIPTTAVALHEYRVRPGSICHGEDAAARAERDYTMLLARLASDGYGLADPGLVRLAIVAFEKKRALNRAFEAARQRGEAATFQEFIARTAAVT